ncbi:hypothetical protein EX30DRAFT_254875 [Ascodesmis nigricans]|uniref:Uncharacterized protein n=1 Tax=Ascodesmis nigricans TaxID=341454 RepID=A0A4S2MYB6_9PEZI|nr:hypothetical protein EX30DRAFT_254875 [Ascodesmis nigricans]
MSTVEDLHVVNRNLRLLHRCSFTVKGSTILYIFVECRFPLFGVLQVAGMSANGMKSLKLPAKSDTKCEWGFSVRRSQSRVHVHHLGDGPASQNPLHLSPDQLTCNSFRSSPLAPIALSPFQPPSSPPPPSPWSLSSL